LARLLVAFFLLIAMCFPSSVGAVGKSTVDPSAGRPKSSEAALSSTDVTQKVTYEAKRKTVVSILADLSAMTGVTLKAGYNNEDWQVRDRRMNIFAKDIPLTHLMDSIARVMKFQWIKHETDGVVSYRLYMDRETLLSAESKRLAEEERLKKRQSEKRKKFLSELEASAAMSDAEREKLKTESPYVYSLFQNDRPERVFPKLFKEVPGARQTFESGDELTVYFGSLSSDVQQGLWCGSKPVDGEGSISISGVNRAGGSIATVTISCYDDPDHTGSVSRSQGLHFSLSDHDSEYANLYWSLENAGVKDSSGQAQLAKVSEQITASEMKDVGEPLTQHPDDPGLSAKVKMKVDGNEFANVFAALAEASGLAVVSDSFERWGNSPAEEMSLRTVLDKLESDRRYNWEKHGSTLELHDRDWCKKRAALVPDAWLEAWRKAFKKNGLLDLDELSQIALLTREQLNANLAQDEVLGQAGIFGFGAGMDDRDLLAAYAALDKHQRALILTKQGLSLDSLADNQSPAVQALLRRCSSLQGGSEGGLRLVGKRETKDGRTYYDFNVSKPSGGFMGLRWFVNCPAYKPPIDKTPAAAAAPQTGK